MTKSDNDHTNWLSTDPWSDVGQSIGGFFSSGGDAMQPGQAGYQSRFASRMPTTSSAGAVAPAAPRTPQRTGWSGGGWGGGSGFEWGGSRSTNNAKSRVGAGPGGRETAAYSAPVQRLTTGAGPGGRETSAYTAPTAGQSVAARYRQRTTGTAAVPTLSPAGTTAKSRAADPMNWRGIARSLGNKGNPNYSQYRSAVANPGVRQGERGTPTKPSNVARVQAVQRNMQSQTKTPRKSTSRSTAR